MTKNENSIKAKVHFLVENNDLLTIKKIITKDQISIEDTIKIDIPIIDTANIMVVIENDNLLLLLNRVFNLIEPIHV